ncbi:uncharacterized protein ACNS7B_009342 isoform 1-T1 [Menidia menidia]
MKEEEKHPSKAPPRRAHLKTPREMREGRLDGRAERTPASPRGGSITRASANRGEGWRFASTQQQFCSYAMLNRTQVQGQHGGGRQHVGGTPRSSGPPLSLRVPCH